MLITMLHCFIYYLLFFKPQILYFFFEDSINTIQMGFFLAFSLNQFGLSSYIYFAIWLFFSVCQNHIQNTSSSMVIWFMRQFILDPVFSCLPNIFLNYIIPTAFNFRFLLPYPNLTLIPHYYKQSSFLCSDIPCNSSPVLPLFADLKISPFIFL